MVRSAANAARSNACSLGFIADQLHNVTRRPSSAAQ